MIFIFVLILFLLTILIEIINFFIKFRIRFEIGTLLGIFLLIMYEIIIRSILIKTLAITNTFEALIFFSGVITLIILLYILLNLKKGIQNTLVFITTIVAFSIFAICLSPIAPQEIKMPLPALKSGWLVLHVSLTFIGEAFFAFAFASGIYYFLIKNEAQKEALERIINKSIIIGYPLFTSGALLFGAIWAYYAWGRFWGWDPKETFALITWLVYTIYLHLRLVSKTRKEITVIVQIIGFLLALFTFLGVNFLLSGLHSYR
ncbi:MAG TPA: cytochrome c biogenesis protein CcsA [Spirochaetota bacterium]|nr:cytochrome c biogenesis protein CcsA [Spirochaetota bacterium]HOL56717.1 cytochrome c biogenesis protein CcsA [Spirochaetota bacterium]HPP04128.1 cytochrome c biogenesis protein CcsA [Spirochaetota bacterium]